MDDRDLLREYAEFQSEAAFTELVARHAGLVYSAAVRQVGDPHLAKDVAQSVFISLAQKPWSVRSPEALSGWLYRATRFTANKFIRTESRRRQRETEAMHRAELEPTSAVTWEQIRPLLEEAIAGLGRKDQDAIILRYFEGKSLRETGRILTLTEKAVSKRTTRALEKLRAHFIRRGVTVSVILLVAAMSENSVQAAPAGLGCSLSSTALAGASAGGGLAGTFLRTIYMSTKTKIALAVAIFALAAAIPLAVQHREILRLQGELAASGRTAVAPGARPGARPLTLAERIAALQKINTDGHQAFWMDDIVQILAGLDSAQFPGVLDAFKRDRTMTIHILAEWAKKDPAQALAWAEAQKDRTMRIEDVGWVFSFWPVKDITSALAAADGLPTADDRNRITMGLIENLAHTDPAASLLLAQKLPPGRNAAYTYHSIFNTWAEKDPQAALAAVADMPPGQIHNDALATIAEAWSRTDPAAVLTWANSLPPSQVRDNAIYSVISTMSLDDAAGAMALTKELPPGDFRTNAIYNVLNELVQSDPKATIAYLDNLPAGSTRDRFTQNVVSEWSRTDPQAAMDWAENSLTGQAYDKSMAGILQTVGENNPAQAAAYLASLSDPAVENIAIPQLASQWAQSDIKNALTWVQSLPASLGDTRLQAFNNVMNSWINGDPSSAAAYLATIPDDPNFKRLANQVAGSWASFDPQAALNWGESLPPGPGRDNAVGSAVSTLAKYDPQSAWSYAQQMPPGSGTVQTEANILATWSSQDPALAAAHLSDLPADTVRDDQPTGTIRDAATLQVVNNWLKQDPHAASEWINALPPSATRDMAVAAMIGVEGKNNLPTAFQWAASIGGETSRNSQMEKVVTQWAKTDPAGAITTVQATPMADEERAALLNYIQKEAQP